MPCKEKDGHHGAWACLAPCSQRSVANQRKRKAVWSSLPELLVWMIKDKLDIFENLAFAAVCRDWRSASARYPKALDSVGDGMPWFWHICEGEEEGDISGCTREIISFDGNRKFKINKMPEISNDASARFSKQGWILLQQRPDSMLSDLSRLFIINLFTSVKIELPDLDGTDGRHQGSFTIKDGFPHRVHLVTIENKFTVSIRTACCGDQVWTLQTYCNVHTYYRRPAEVISIGQKVYVLDGASKMTVFDVVEQSSKELPPLPGCGFIAEHDDGQLIYIERRLTQSFDIIFDFSSFSVYKYNDDDAGSWERLDMKSAAAVTNTCWFTCGYHACIAAKGGGGLKVYDLCPYDQVAANPKEEHYYVVVYDLIAGTAQKQSIPFQVQLGLKWIAIG